MIVKNAFQYLVNFIISLLEFWCRVNKTIFPTKKILAAIIICWFSSGRLFGRRCFSRRISYYKIIIFNLKHWCKHLIARDTLKQVIKISTSANPFAFVDSFVVYETVTIGFRIWKVIARFTKSRVIIIKITETLECRNTRSYFTLRGICAIICWRWRSSCWDCII